MGRIKLVKQYQKFYVKYVKRLIDIVLSIIGIVLLGWLMILISVILKIQIGNPVLFKQRRAGYKGKEFVIYKFRTMNNKRDKNGVLLPDSERLTGIGAFLRKTSMDELPQLFNILKGDLSIIGPRPLPVEYLPIYTKWENRRHLVKPGLVGLAGVNGRNNQSWKSKFKYDNQYVDNVCFMLDVQIFLKCIKTVIKKTDIYCDEECNINDSFTQRIEGIKW